MNDSTAFATRDIRDVMFKIITTNDLSLLSEQEQIDYYYALCDRYKLDPLSRPFMYLVLPGKGNDPDKISLYATKACTDQLRTIHGISIPKAQITSKIENGVFQVWVTAIAPDGREDTDVGAVSVVYNDGNILRGDTLANAIKRAVTQAKRRVTLAICGLTMLDESEIPDIPGARPLPNQSIPNIPEDTPSSENASNSHPAAILASFPEIKTGTTIAATDSPAETGNSAGETMTLESLQKRALEYMLALEHDKPGIASAIDPQNTERAKKALTDLYSGEEEIHVETAATIVVSTDYRRQWPELVHAQVMAIRQAVKLIKDNPALRSELIEAAREQMPF